MVIFWATLSPMLNLFLCIAVVFALTKTKILPESSSKVMANLETWLFCPALSFMTMMRYCTVDIINYNLTNMALASVGMMVAMAIAIPLGGSSRGFRLSYLRT